ncbi:AmmeMemoRadiSam system protein A [Corallincola platygyrae]|uniref:AmmeMemoRadiSam system protein A n=1 Tax=Corallincola platygyrae TaxID=1193278 RepID=A0ABW4XLX9_9GAMM
MPALPYTHSEEEQQILLGLAARSIEYGLIHQHRWAPAASHLPEALAAQGASFVTLHQQKGTELALRGCIGSVSPFQPLWLDVVSHAYDAAFRDPRFSSLQQQECDDLLLEVSVLSPPAPLEKSEYPQLLQRLTPHVDGVLLEGEGRRSLFLPQVWQQLPDAKAFLTALLHKGGWPGDCWQGDNLSESITVSLFQVVHYQRPYQEALSFSLKDLVLEE